MDTPPPLPSNYKYYLRPNQQNKYPNNYFSRLINVNIFVSDNTTCTVSPVEHSGPVRCTHRSNATIATTKRDDTLSTQFSFVSSPTSNTITLVPIQTSAFPPHSKMGQNTTNDPPFPGANQNLQGQSLLHWRSRLDINDNNDQAAQRSHQLGHAGVDSVINLINVSKQRKICVRRYQNAFIFDYSP